MQFRLNPVTLITGAGSGIGAACAHELARKSQGGLILADRDEAALAFIADELDAAGAAPERVSTLAFDAADPDRWAHATAFVLNQYGRLDWAVVNTAASPAEPAMESDLVAWGAASKVAHLETAILSLRALMPLIGKNTRGGAIVVTTASSAIKSTEDAHATPGLLQLVRAAAHEGAPDSIRINAVAPGGADTPMWNDMPWLHELAKQHGGEAGAFERIADQTTPAARYAEPGGVTRLIVKLLTEDDTASGATLVVDGGGAL